MTRNATRLRLRLQMSSLKREGGRVCYILAGSAVNNSGDGELNLGRNFGVQRSSVDSARRFFTTWEFAGKIPAAGEFALMFERNPFSLSV